MAKKRVKFTIYILSLFLIVQAKGNTVIQSVVQDLELSGGHKIGRGYNPVFKNIQVRFGHENTDNETQVDQTLRLEPFALSAIPSHVALFKNQKRRVELINSQKTSMEIKSYLASYFQAYYNIQMKSHQDSLVKLYKNKRRVLARMLKKNATEIDKVASNDIAVYDAAIKNTELNEEIFAALENLNQKSKKVYTEETVKKAPMSFNLAKMTSTFQAAKKRPSIGGEIAKLELNSSDLSMKIDYEEESKLVDFIDISTETRVSNDRDETESSIGFKIGINLPFVASRNTSTVEKRIKRLRSSYKQKQELKEARIESALLETKIDALLESIRSLTQSRFMTNSKKYLRIYSKRKGISPLKILDLKESILKNRLRLESLRHELVVTYLDFLVDRGFLVNKKDVSYF